VVIGTATATDTVTATPAITSDAPDTFPVGATTVTWTATDDDSNSVTATQTVTITDNTAPLIMMLGANPQTIQAGLASYVELGATAFDAVGGDLTGMIAIDTSNVDTTIVDSYFVTYMVSDGIQGTTATRTVVVADSTDPVIIISDPPDFIPAGPFILNPGETEIVISWPVGAEDLPAGLSISCSVGDGDPPELISPVGTPVYVDGILTATFSYNFEAGSTSVTCTVMDQGGNTTTSDPFLVTVISVIDAILSVETDEGGGTTATVFESEMIANISATDLSISCLATDPAKFEVGEHDILCTVTDGAGNSAEANFVLDVSYRYGIDFKTPKGNVRAGSTVPLDWSYTQTVNGTTTKIDSSGLVVELFWSGPYLERSCTDPDQAPDVFDSGSDANDSGSSYFRYSSSKDEWQYSWQTPNRLGWHKIFISPPGEVDASTKCINLR